MALLGASQRTRRRHWVRGDCARAEAYGPGVTPGAGRRLGVMAGRVGPPVRWHHRSGHHRSLAPSIRLVASDGGGQRASEGRHGTGAGWSAPRAQGWRPGPIPSPSSRRPDQRAERDGSSGNDLPPLDAAREVCSADGPDDGDRDGARPKGFIHPGARSTPAGGLAAGAGVTRGLRGTRWRPGGVAPPEAISSTWAGRRWGRGGWRRRPGPHAWLRSSSCGEKTPGQTAESLPSWAAGPGGPWPSWRRR